MLKGIDARAGWPTEDDAVRVIDSPCGRVVSRAVRTGVSGWSSQRQTETLPPGSAGSSEPVAPHPQVQTSAEPQQQHSPPEASPCPLLKPGLQAWAWPSEKIKMMNVVRTMVAPIVGRHDASGNFGPCGYLWGQWSAWRIGIIA